LFKQVIAQSPKMEMLRRGVDAIDERIGKSTFGRIFRLEGCGHVSLPERIYQQAYAKQYGFQEKELPNTRFTREIRAGITTFFTM
jgi:AGZA family xanthine/uracil permease-like MFS transporter